MLLDERLPGGRGLRAVRRYALLLGAAVTVALPSTGRGQEPAGRITGRVVAEPGGRAVGGALVRLPSGQATTTDAAGDFTMLGVAPGRTHVAAVAEGCSVGFVEVDVPGPGDVVTVIRVPVGERAGSEDASDGALVGLSGEELRRRNFRSVYDALRAIAPSMVGSFTGEVGGARTLSNRSSGSFTTGEPLILLDGIRLTNATVAALDDFDVDDLERIEVARGAAAAWRYGLGAGAGAIILTSTRAAAAEADLGSCEVVFP
jgi:outer membrane receptor protein involved in Fe transport